MTDTMPSDTSREPRPEKVAIVDEVKERLQASSGALLAEYRGLKVTELATLRNALSAAGGDFKIYKNTLVRFAVRDLGMDIDEALLTGPTAIAFVEGDVAGVAKALRDYARTNPNLIVKGGILGSSALSADQARALADLPTREVLLASLAGGLAAPLRGFAGLLQALPRNLAYGLKALIDQGGNPGVSSPPAEPADAAPASGSAEATPSAEPADAAPAPDDVAPAAEPADAAPASGSAEATPSAEPADAAAAIERDAPADEAPAIESAEAPAVEPVEAAPAPEVGEPSGAAMANVPTDAAPAAAADAEVAPAAGAEDTEAAPAAEADTEAEAAPAETDDTPEEAS